MERMQEFNIKLNRLREMMGQEGMDACYIKRVDNFAWLTCGGINYVALGGEVGNCGLLITEDRLYAITNNIEASRMREEEKLEGFGFELLSATWYEENFEDKLIQSVCADKKVAKDFGAGNIHGKIQPLRFSLTEAEVERYKIAGAMVSRIVEEVAAVIRPGDTEWSVTAKMEAAAKQEGLEVLSLFCGSDERIYNYRHAIATSKQIRERVQMGGNFRYKGLVICLTRYVNFVPVSEELKKQYLDNVKIDCLMMKNSIPGESYQKPFLAAKAAYEELGYVGEFDKHHQGGPIGYVPRDYRIDFSHTGIIPENQAFCWNPSITGTKSEDTVIATKDGILFVTKPYLFPTVTVEVEDTTFTRPYILEKF